MVQKNKKKVRLFVSKLLTSKLLLIKQKVRRFSSVVSCSTKRAHRRLVASSIAEISWQAGPRSSSQRNGELSCITSSPKLARRSRHTWIFFTRRERGRQKLALVIHFRSVSRLTSSPSWAKCSAASVGPKSA